MSASATEGQKEKPTQRSTNQIIIQLNSNSLIKKFQGEKYMESVKINSLEIENVKRIKAVKIKPTQSGLTVIGGNNKQGKTSVIDSIAWALGGDKHRPSNPAREGSTIPPILHIELSNGLIVERKGKNSDLKVTDPNGQKGGQQLLNSFIEQLALDLPKFMESSDKEKANTLLKIIGVGDELYALEEKEKKLYQERLAIGRIADQKAKHAKEQVFYDDAPSELVSASELIRQQQEILARNGENQKKRQNVSKYENDLESSEQKISNLENQIAALKTQLENEQNEHEQILQDLQIAKTDALSLVDESTEELERSINNIEEINRKVRANMDKEKAEEDAKAEKAKYDDLTAEIEEIRDKKIALLKGADLPLPELLVEDNALTYKGQKWDNMSGSEQLKVATAIVRKLNPQCGFVLIDKLEQMDINTMNEFGRWLEKEGLQAIATRVSTGDECSIIIEDGYVSEESQVSAGIEAGVTAARPGLQPATGSFTPTTWKEGEF